MANIRRYNDPDPQSDQRRFNRVYQYQQLGPNAGRIPFLAPQQNSTLPRDENYWDMLKFTFCPRVRFLSFTMFLLLANTVIFGVCIRDGIVKEGSLLQITDEGLIRFGALVPVNVKTNGSFWLLFTSLFVSADFLQYLTNCLIIVILCSNVEQAIGSLSTIIIYIGGGALGALFGAMVHCCVEDDAYVETSSAIYAMLGSATAFMILNWNALARLEDIRCFLLCLVIMLTFLVVLITLSSVGSLAIDKAGIVGGLLGGFFLTLAAATPVVSGGTYEKKCKIFGCTFASIQLFITLLMLILVVE